MKRKHTTNTALLLLGGLLVSSLSTFGHQPETQSQIKPDSAIHKVTVPEDTVIIEDVKTGEKRKIKIYLPGEENGIITLEKTEKEYKLDTLKGKSATTSGRSSARKGNADKKGKPILGITFSRIDLGLTKPVAGGSFSMTGDNEIFKYRPGKTVNFGFDVLQAGYRFNREFRMFLSAGFDWTYLRLENDLIFDAKGSPYTSGVDAGEDLTKNRLTSTYMRLPLTFEVRPGGDKTRIAFGPMAGFLLKGTQRYKLENGNKVKTRGDYDYAPFQYGAFARFMVGGLGIYGKYYFNDMFENSPTGAGLQNFTFGLTLGF